MYFVTYIYYTLKHIQLMFTLCTYVKIRVVIHQLKMQSDVYNADVYIYIYHHVSVSTIKSYMYVLRAVLCIFIFILVTDITFSCDNCNVDSFKNILHYFLWIYKCFQHSDHLAFFRRTLVPRVRWKKARWSEWYLQHTLLQYAKPLYLVEAKLTFHNRF